MTIYGFCRFYSAYCHTCINQFQRDLVAIYAICDKDTLSGMSCAGCGARVDENDQVPVQNDHPPKMEVNVIESRNTDPTGGYLSSSPRLRDSSLEPVPRYHGPPGGRLLRSHDSLASGEPGHPLISIQPFPKGPAVPVGNVRLTPVDEGDE